MNGFSLLVRPQIAFMVLCLLWLIDGHDSTCFGKASTPKKPNVVFLAVDDMNDWVGFLDNAPRAITPNLDRLAKRGTVFTNAHTAGVFCAPSRAAIFSGQFASTTGCYQTATYFVDHPEIESLQMSFQQSGYRTLGAGKLFHHGAGMIDQRGWTQFFLRTEAQRRSGWAMESWSEGTPFPKPFPHSPFNQGKEITGGLFLEWGSIPDQREGEMADTIRTDWVVDQLSKQQEDPFFLALGLYAPHFPNYCPKKYFDLYNRDLIETPEYLDGDLDDLPEKIKKIKTNRSRIHHELESLGAVRDAIHGYLASISYADAMIGRVLDALEAGPHFENTIVVFWSDHGYHHGEKGDWGKHTLWERTSNVPYVWAGPGIASGQETDVTVSLIDLFPTLIELCDLKRPHQKLEGVSIANILAKPETALDRNVYLPHMNPGEYAVINRKWRYIRYGEDGEELYDVAQDPNEWHNLAGIPEYADVKADLQSEAPTEFVSPSPRLNARRDLVVEGTSFSWQRGQGNYKPSEKYLPYSDDAEGKSSGRNDLNEVKRDSKSNTNRDQATQKPANEAKRKVRKNILFVICDDLNTHVSTSGYQQAITPALDQLSKHSMTFDRAYCQYPVCGPSRASLLSGLYPERTGVLDNQSDFHKLHPELQTMPEFFRDHGYWTASTGKVFHNEKLDPGKLAWDQSVRYDNDELPIVREGRRDFEEEFGSIELQENRKKWRDLSKELAAPLNAQTPPGHGISGLADEQHKDGKNAKQVIDWLREKPFNTKPFFIALGLQKPHVPFLAPKKYFELHPRQEITFEPNRADLWDSIPNAAMSNRFEAFGFELGIENGSRRREYMQAYHACVSFVDSQLGRVIQALKSEGFWEETIIVFTSDHGYHLGDHFLWGKVTLFDIGARVPMIVRVPEISAAGERSQAMVELLDLYPTLVDLVGLKPPVHLQGQSLRPLLGYPERLGKNRIAYTVVRRGPKLGHAIRDQRWRYTRWPDGEELYHLPNDPHERRNLVGKSHVHTKLEEYRRLLERKVDSVRRPDTAATRGTGEN